MARVDENFPSVDEILLSADEIWPRVDENFPSADKI
jgi:hypothetical protein